MTRKKKIEHEGKVRFCPLLNKLCILEDCGWYLERMDTCAVQVIPYNLWMHNNKLDAVSTNLERLLNGRG